ncbi:unnamed protein product [Hermetia illucens]|uniref:Chitin-binding type-2 domain-containing protein n=1 Tax=Hermetia illucens TaxID=343691 RepID=A0A7R8YSF2_HERIL|nr:chitin-binding domain protein cbd-1-like [Hermetia illucens]CAD7080519.1 unnamed protein product [Hermetia illucens]
MEKVNFLIILLGCFLAISRDAQAVRRSIINTDIPEGVHCPIYTRNALYIPHPDFCDKFLVCFNGRLAVKSCPDGLHWDNNSKTCNWPEEAQCPLVEEDAIDEEVKCDPYANPLKTTFIRHPTDCSKFYMCQFGRKHETQCPDGLHFNIESSECDYPELAKCEVIPGTTARPSICPAEGYETKGFPDVCSKFVQCVEGLVYVRSCPKGLFWSESEKRCEYAHKSECMKGQSVLSPGEDNDEVTYVPDCPHVLDEDAFVAHPNDCTKYFQCWNGNAFLRECPQGLHWNAEDNQCDWPSRANCPEAISTTPATEATDEPTTESTEEPEIDTTLEPTEEPTTESLETDPDEDSTTELTTEEPATTVPTTDTPEENETTQPPTNPPDTETIPKDVDCPLDTENMLYIPHPESCDKFLQCFNGRLFLQSCPEGLHWDNNSKTCNWPEQAQCPLAEGDPNEDEVKCDPDANPNETTFVPHPSDCSKFYMCQFGRKHETKCPEGLHFNVESSQCDYPEFAKCQLISDTSAIPSICPAFGVETKGIPKICSKYIQCVHGRPYVRSCPKFLFWSESRKRCDYAHNSECLNGSSIVSPGGDDNEGGYVPDCPHSLNKDTFVPYPGNCRKYFQCWNGHAFVRHCPLGLHWNAVINRCDWPFRANCTETIPTTPATESTEEPSEGPGTEAPGTEAPETEAPGTEPPATEAPGSEAPGTEPPGSEAPGTEAPGTDAPETEAPGTEPPATEAPGSEAPGTESPETEPPATEAPGSEAPGTKPPATEPPATEAPGSEAPETEAPATEPPATEAPGTKPPATEPPATQAPGSEAPGAKPPTTEAPGSEAPATEAPATELPPILPPADGAPAIEGPRPETSTPSDPRVNVSLPTLKSS